MKPEAPGFRLGFAPALLLLLAGVSPAGANDPVPTPLGPAMKIAPSQPGAVGGTLPFPAASAPVDPMRFGEKVPDAAFGAFQRGLYKTALNLALEAAARGDASASTLAAEIYAQGLGVPQNPEEAVRLYEQAAGSGIPEAQFQTALFKLEGKYAKPDRKGAAALLEKAALSGHVLAGFNLAQIKFRDASTDDQKKSVYDLYLKAANAGLADAQYAVSQFLASGTGNIPVDEALARAWLEKAARQNFDTAQLDLGTWMIEGKGGARDYETGFKWMKTAAEGGNVEAQRRLSHLYEDGIGTKGDPVAAAAWYIVAKRQGMKDTDLDDMLEGLTAEQLQQSIELANKLR